MIYQQLIKQTLIGIVTGRMRSTHWPECRKKFILAHNECTACNCREGLEVHHKIPFYIDPSLELKDENLITLCRYCHLVHGHLRDWSRWNVTVIEDAAKYKLKIEEFKKSH
jgi:5-methylcytosine-specific restriction endonuclease McrA